jgi:nicotinate phosphoribosyltransferase
MNIKGIIRSIIDNDLYKFTMQQAVFILFPRHYVKFMFINRGKTRFPEGFAVRLRQELKKMEELALTDKEVSFLTRRCGSFLRPTFIDFLRGYRYDSSEVGVTQDGGDLKVEIQGFWYRTILWEVPLMALISELYFEMTGEEIDSRDVRKQINISKGNTFHRHGMKVADFGTRRRYSFDNQLEVVQDLKSCFNNGEPFLIGTSNVYIAMLEDLTPIGTHAHEWFMFHAAMYGYQMANTKALENWVKVYQGDLGIALTDTYTTDVFFKTFDKKYSKLFDGVRHDSEDPYDFTDKTLAHYISQNINPLSKTIVYSDGLRTDLAVDIHKYCLGKINDSYGIGTHFTNDVGVDALNMVIKITAVQIHGEWVDCVKLSDSPVKHTGTEEEVSRCKNALRITTKKTTQVS